MKNFAIYTITALLFTSGLKGQSHSFGISSFTLYNSYKLENTFSEKELELNLYHQRSKGLSIFYGYDLNEKNSIQFTAKYNGFTRGYEVNENSNGGGILILNRGFYSPINTLTAGIGAKRKIVKNFSISTGLDFGILTTDSKHYDTLKLNDYVRQNPTQYPNYRVLQIETNRPRVFQVLVELSYQYKAKKVAYEVYVGCMQGFYNFFTDYTMVQTKEGFSNYKNIYKASINGSNLNFGYRIMLHKER